MKNKIALVPFFYFLYCQHLRDTVLVCVLKYQATELFSFPIHETSFNITTPSFRGCMKNVKNPNTASVIFDETVGVSKKCSDDWKVINKVPYELLLEVTGSSLSINPGPLCLT